MKTINLDWLNIKQVLIIFFAGIIFTLISLQVANVLCVLSFVLLALKWKNFNNEIEGLKDLNENLQTKMKYMQKSGGFERYKIIVDDRIRDNDYKMRDDDIWTLRVLEKVKEQLGKFSVCEQEVHVIRVPGFYTVYKLSLILENWGYRQLSTAETLAFFSQFEESFEPREIFSSQVIEDDDPIIERWFYKKLNLGIWTGDRQVRASSAHERYTTGDDMSDREDQYYAAVPIDQ